MNPRSLTPLWRIPRSSRRSTAWKNVACETENARWCTQPGSVGVRAGSATRSSLVKMVIRRPSPGSKYRWLSAALSRLGCSKTNGIPSTPSQKSIDVWRSAPTSVMWWTPWVWSLRTPTLYSVARHAPRGTLKDHERSLRHLRRHDPGAGARQHRDAVRAGDVPGGHRDRLPGRRLLRG